VDRADESIFKLAIHDDSYIEWILERGFGDTEASGLDARAQALVRIGALAAVDAPPSAYMCAIESALAAGATRDDVVGVLVALLPSIGADRVAAAAPRLGLALGFDVEEQLERLD
jgi:4-carboxymuconolactone decarboxylase